MKAYEHKDKDCWCILSCLLAQPSVLSWRNWAILHSKCCAAVNFVLRIWNLTNLLLLRLNMSFSVTYWLKLVFPRWREKHSSSKVFCVVPYYRVMEKRDIFLYCDIHGHNRKQNVFMYGCEREQEPKARHLCPRAFPLLLSKNCPDKVSKCQVRNAVSWNFKHQQGSLSSL